MQIIANVKVEADERLLHGTKIYNNKIYQKAANKIIDHSFNFNYGALNWLTNVI